MKASELVVAIENFIATYGDLPVSLEQRMDDNVMQSKDVFLGFDEYPEGNELNIRNYIY